MKKQDSRPDLPADLERALFIEAGFRCSVPNCRATESLQIDHIEDWSKVREHRFENMIVLCANCHGRKSRSADPRRLDKKALRAIKDNLIMLNNRYSDLERRILEIYGENPHYVSSPQAAVYLPWHFELLVKYLIRDGLFSLDRMPASIISTRSDGSLFNNAEIRLTLTEEGARVVKKVYGAD